MLTGRTLLRALVGAALCAAFLTTSAPALAAVEKPCSTVAPADDPVKILIAGDSLTHGSRGDWTYRYFLDKQLRAASVNFDLVGNNNWLIDPNKSTWPFCEYQDPNFDTDYTAYPGKKLSDYNVATSNTANLPWIQYEVGTWDADVLVMVLGGNDIAKGATPQATVTEAATFVANARLANPDVKIVLSTVPTGGPYDEKPNASYNSQLAAAVPGWSTEQSPVVLADILQNWGTATNTWDQIHPNVVGEQLIAQGLTDALHQLDATTFPVAGAEVDPAYKVGPRKPATNFTATMSGSNVNLAWTLPVGTTGVQVMKRDTTGGVIGPWVVAKDLSWVPFDFYNIGGCQEANPCTSYTLTGLQPGHRYDLDLHVEKGLAVAVDLWALTPGEAETGSADGGAVSVQIPGTVQLAKPVLSTPTPGVHAASLTWAAVPNATGYQVQWRLSTVGASSGPVTTTATSRTIGDLAPGKTYVFQVRATRSGSNPGPWSDERTALIKANPMGTPTKPVVKALGGKKVRVTWKAVSGANRYLVQARLKGGTWKSQGYVTKPSFDSGKLTRKKTYEYRYVPYDATVAGRTSPVSTIVVK